MNGIIYNFPAEISYGFGESKRIGSYIGDLHPHRVLIVTDKGVERVGLLEGVKSSLNDKGIEFIVYSNVQPNPTDQNVKEGVDVCLNNGCDVVVAIGGGSPIDAAKGISILATHPGTLDDYYRDAESGSLITDDVLAFVAVPTTSGTGSEVSRGAIITDTTQNRKRSIGSRYLLPNVVILDPGLTISMPPRLTAHTGLDALSHCIEAFVVDRYAPIADAFAREGMKRISASLVRAHDDGKNRLARGDMIMASNMGALAFQKGLGAVHSLAHQLSTQAEMPHGAACGIMLPHVMRFNIAGEPSKNQVVSKYAEMARIFGVNVSRKSVKEASEEAVRLVERLLSRLSVNPHLRNWGVDEADIEEMARNAIMDHCHPKNPRSCKKADMVALYKAAM